MCRQCEEYIAAGKVGVEWRVFVRDSSIQAINCGLVLYSPVFDYEM
jgi:hypothetical protein